MHTIGRLYLWRSGVWVVLVFVPHLEQLSLLSLYLFAVVLLGRE
jgi:hypothetical protein